MIEYKDGKVKYYDKHGKEITDGCCVRFSNGDVKKVYLTENDELGTDATNPVWIEKGRAVPCEYGVYPLTREDTEEVEVVE